MTPNALARALRMDTRSADRLRAVACEPLPRPAAVPDVERALAAAIAVRMDAAPAMTVRGETTEAGTVRPGGAA